MIKQLKHIMFNIARLPSVDQRWILRHLSATEMKTLNTWQGLKLLKDAQRFRSLKACDLSLSLNEAPEPLPAFCKDLATETPLYAAIIIEQGRYPWKNLFLSQFDTQGAIKASLENQVLDIKPRVKEAVFTEWENSISFERLLEDAHG